MTSNEFPFAVAVRCRGLAADESQSAERRFPQRRDTHFHSALLFRTGRVMGGRVSCGLGTGASALQHDNDDDDDHCDDDVSFQFSESDAERNAEACMHTAAVAHSRAAAVESQPLASESSILALIDPCAVSDFSDIRERLCQAVSRATERRVPDRKGTGAPIPAALGDLSGEDALAILRDSVFHGKDGVRLFPCDTLFGPRSSNEEIYKTMVRPLVRSAHLGFSGTCLAYGQTGSGKTYTMLGELTGGSSSADSRAYDESSGPSPVRGLCSLAAAEILALGGIGADGSISGSPPPSTVFASYMELYNERLCDLLAGADESTAVRPSFVSSSSSAQARPQRQRDLEIREQPDTGVFVAGLSEVRIISAAQLEELVRRGSKRRATARTSGNAASSRSHAILQLKVRTRMSCAVTDGEVTVAQVFGQLPSTEDRDISALSYCATLSFVDLAGSERAQSTCPGPEYGSTMDRGVRASRQREGSHINRSLLALGNCINALASAAVARRAGRSLLHRKTAAVTSNSVHQISRLWQTDRHVAPSVSEQAQAFVPYRSSKLTRLLKDSLGGTTRTVLIATISPSCLAFSESLSTLWYAQRASVISRSVVQRVEKTVQLPELSSPDGVGNRMCLAGMNESSEDDDSSFRKAYTTLDVGSSNPSDEPCGENEEAYDEPDGRLAFAAGSAFRYYHTTLHRDQQSAGYPAAVDCHLKGAEEDDHQLIFQLEEEIRAMETQLRVAELLSSQLGLA